ncbi:MAG: hypothetical protein HY825_06865 [Acidobacteria bacterium]|nr:hypothetical protein [Acidobacteriota bacterium]
MSLLRRLLLAGIASWFGSAFLGLLFAASATGTFQFSTLLLPGVLPVALYGSSAVSVLIFPFAIWATRTAVRNLMTYGSLLFLALTAWVLFIIPTTGRSGPVGLLVLAIVGLLVLGLLPNQTAAARSPT